MFLKAMAEETGPNDARCVIWAIIFFLAIIKFFYYYFCVLLILTIIYIDTTHVFNGSRKQVTKTGPNNATGIIWAIGKIFFSFMCYLY